MYRNSKTVRGDYCMLRFKDNPRRSEYRLAVVVSRKTHKSAVVRNRIRRRIYEYMRNIEPEIKKHKDMVITVYSDSFADIDTKEVVRSLSSLLKKADII